MTDDPGLSRRTLRTQPVRSVLAAVRNPASLNRIATVLPLLSSDERLDVKVTVDEGSRFGAGIGRRVHDFGMDIVSWDDARSTPTDLVIAAHVHPKLAALAAPIVVLPHGAGYNRRRPGPPEDNSIVGLSRAELTCGGVVVPDVIALSHDEQRGRLQQMCPEANEFTRTVGDPTFDRMLASQPRRGRFRSLLNVPAGNKLVVVTSTWNEYSALGEHPTLVHRLAAQLPFDGFTIAVVLHPNIWAGHSPYCTRAILIDPLDSGVIVVPPDCWEAALLAADLVIGDHGSVSFYGVALGVPFLQASDGLAELDPESPTAMLSRAADRLDADGDLRAQVERALDRPASPALIEITGRTLGQRGKSWEILHQLFYELMDLAPPRQSPRMHPVPDPFPERGNDVAAFLTNAVLRDPDVGSGAVELERFPAIVAANHRGIGDRNDLFLVVDDIEVERSLRQNAEIFLRTGVISAREAATWTNTVFIDYPGAAVAVAATVEGFLLRRRTGQLLEVVVGGTAEPGAFVAGAAVHSWLLGGHSVADIVKLTTRLGDVHISVLVRPVI
jgi:hypothetical protein